MYTPQQLDDSSLPGLALALRSELARLSLALSQPTDYLALKTLYTPPGRIFDGMIIKADGSTWNPGGGAGVYVRTGAAWTKL